MAMTPEDLTARTSGAAEGYDEFVEKFRPKKTTDDCYTPPLVYDALCAWVEAEYGVTRDHFVRPFYPGGDFEKHEYAPDDIVVDNPPFSIMKDILKHYVARGVRFFLFAPALTCFHYIGYSDTLCLVCTGNSVTYDNGAKVRTSFVTNMERGVCVRTAPGLYEAIDAANRACLDRQHAPVYSYPKHVLRASDVHTLSLRGVDFRVPTGEARVVASLDSQRAQKKSIYGHGLLLSDRMAADRAAADRAAADRAAADRAAADRADAMVWTLSDRERAIISGLGRGCA